MAAVNWNACLAFILAAEGGYVDDPQDPGGATNMGITLRELSLWRHGLVTKPDVQALSRDEAASIYQANYWQVTHCPDLPSGVDLMVFDAAVNLGCSHAARLLQMAVHATPDGAIGPATLALVEAANPPLLITALARARADYYQGLATFAHFGAGWLARVQKASALAAQLAAAAL